MPEGSVVTAEEVQRWASSVDPGDGALLSLLALGGLESNPDPCPASIELAGTTRWQGGCEDAEGVGWVGSASAKTADMLLNAHFKRFGAFKLEPRCDLEYGTTYDGDIETRDVHDGTVFDIDLVVRTRELDEACRITTEVFAIDSRMRSTQRDGDPVTTWNSEGTIGDLEYGKVSFRTIDRQVDRSVCRTESLSGRLELRADDHLALIHYDGTRDCDENQTVTWELDGQPMGELEGVGLGCQIDGETPRGLGLFGLLVLGLLAWRRPGIP